MGDLVTGFTLGNAAILGNVCLLPLYPGLFALLAAKADSDGRAVRWMGVLVLGGVLTSMIVIAAVLAGLNAVFADVVPWLLPIAFGGAILLGLVMLAGRNPLERLGTGQAPLVSSPSASAFLYGVALAPMTLPCTGPVILGAFAIGSVAGVGGFARQLAFFLAFGLGFGWPLVVLPLLTGTRQRAFTGWMTRNHDAVTRVSGALLVGAAVIGLWAEYW